LYRLNPFPQPSPLVYRGRRCLFGPMFIGKEDVIGSKDHKPEMRK